MKYSVHLVMSLCEVDHRQSLGGHITEENGLFLLHYPSVDSSSSDKCESSWAHLSPKLVFWLVCFCASLVHAVAAAGALSPEFIGAAALPHAANAATVQMFPPSLPIFQPFLPGGSLGLCHLINSLHPEEIGSFPPEEQQAGSSEHTPCASILEGEKLLPANIASLIESRWRAATFPEQHKQMPAHTIWNSHLAGSLDRNYRSPRQCK